MRYALNRFLVVGAALASLTSTAYAQEICDREGVVFRGAYCRALLSRSYTPGHIDGDVKVSVKALETDSFSCDMARLIAEQRAAIGVRGTSWSPEVALEVARYYKSFFSQRGEQALGVAVLDITPPSECASDGVSSYFVWSGASVTDLPRVNACTPVKLLVVLRLSSFCEGELKVFRFSSQTGGKEEFSAESVELGLGRTAGRRGEVFRDRYSDVARHVR